jgi:ankyrin repeat protein
MPRTITPHTNLESLRKEAKRLRNAIAAGDPKAIARFHIPGHSTAPSLRDVQHALAHEYGFASWAALKQEVDDRVRTHQQRVRLFLEKSVHRYGVDPGSRKWGDYERDGPARGALAARLLAANPEIARENIHTAVVAHDVDAVRAFLAKNTHLASDRHTFDGWTPLQRLAYARLPNDALTKNAISIATLLLDAGADPNATWPGHNSFTALTGVIGAGEFGQSPHPLAEAMARLLIARGADPLNGQALYNTSLAADDTFWLDLLWGESGRLGRTAKWGEPTAGLIGLPLDYLLGNAVARHHPKRTAWLLAHGADARAVNAYSKIPVIKHAAVAGQQEMVDLLVRHGAAAPVLSEEELFVSAAMRGDLSALRNMARAHPEYLRAPDAMIAAIHAERPEVAELLLDLGMSADVAGEQDYRALHYAADSGAVDIARLLIARGAEVDPLETRYGGSPLTHAVYNRRPEIIALLAPLSRNFRGLCFAGALDRVRELLVEEPARANREDRPGEPALFCLPDDEDCAMQLAELLLSCGADPTFRNPLGQTPAEAARRRGMDDVADFLSTTLSNKKSKK